MSATNSPEVVKKATVAAVKAARKRLKGYTGIVIVSAVDGGGDKGNLSMVVFGRRGTLASMHQHLLANINSLEAQIYGE